MLHKAGFDSKVSRDEAVIASADKLILPGVGAFDACASKLRQSGLVSVLEEKVLRQKTSLLGICVGLQLLMEHSEEGTEPGLGWMKGSVVRFDAARMPAGVKIPHMGWTDVHPARPSALLNGLDEPRFYFVHSYHVLPSHQEDVLLTADYGYPFAAALESGNLMGVQFHPEKSHRFGMQLLTNFVQEI
jgi:glutamine amidotransferase